MGLCGHIAQSDPRSVLSDIGSVCIRIAGQWPGAADALMPHVSTLTKGILIIGPPGSGKTTILRDFARQLCIRQPALQLSIVDERGELAACVGGIPQLDIGNCSDVLDGLPKARAIPWLVRSMHPHWIITDELLGQSDAEAVLEAASCGIAVCASAHGGSLSDAAARPSLAGLMAQRAFDLYAVLSADDAGRTISLHDRTGNPLPL